MNLEKDDKGGIRKEIIPTERSGRCFIYGKGLPSTRHIFMVLHGYGQLGSGIIRHFSSLDPEEYLVIAPEGLSRFYINGLYGKVGASWMTKEDRELEIKDQISYLDRVSAQYLAPYEDTGAKIHVLGFSQGVATLSRWLAHQKRRFDSVIFWAGTAPLDSISPDNPAFQKNHFLYVVGNEDQFLPKRVYTKHLHDLEKSSGRPLHLIEYEGKHRIEQDALQRVFDVIRNDGGSH